ncbi:MAG: class I SAM-dependent methyltransferase [Flavipsychrobacter sp.]
MSDNNPVYNTIGTTYNTTRNADPYLAGRLYHLLSPDTEGKYLDIGCGTGNYFRALSDMGVDLLGIDPSETMLQAARANNPDKTFLCAKAENIPFDDNYFDGGIGTFTMHHWDSIADGMKELNRIAKPGARFVFLSFAPEQMDRYWLKHYFPDMIKLSGDLVPSIPKMTELLLNNGFNNVTTEKYFVHEELTDLFLFAYKYQPEKYLDPKVRSGASSFRLFVEEEELNNGLAKLEEDINSGAIDAIIENYENDLGDYLFYVATK